MDTLSTVELKSLVEARTGPYISISLPTERVGLETRQNPIRLKKLLRNAEERLAAGGVRAAEAQQLLDPAHKLLEDALFWLYQGDGLILYINPKLFRYYRLPFKLNELVFVGERFYIKPVVRALTRKHKFYVLALSQNKVRLLEASQYSAQEVELKGAPTSMADTLKYDQLEKQLSSHTVPGRTIFFGEGAPVDIVKEHILRYCHQVDDGLRKALAGQRAPLVFAGVESLFSVYKDVNTYPHLVGSFIAGNPDLLSPDELRKRAWDIVRPSIEQEQHNAADRYHQVANATESRISARASNKITQVAPAAYQGRVEVLFVQTDVQEWGAYAPEVGAVHEFDQPELGSEDMLDFAAAHTLLNGGSVYAVEGAQMPNGSSVAAVFRY
jgi:hypothetical protein